MSNRPIGAPLHSGYVARNSWWFAHCPKHGETAHLSYLGGKCDRCAAERIAAIDAKSPPLRSRYS